MSTRSARILVAGLAGAVIIAGSAVAATAAGEAGQSGVVAVAAVDESLAQHLAFNREEERMARDLYQLFAQTYPDARTFEMIARSEQRHYDAIGRLITAHGVADPSVGKDAGSYADAALQALYDGWKAQGLTSLDAAYRAAVELERRDIADLDAAIAAVTQQDVTTVLSRLRAASTRHEAAFTAAAAGQDTGTGPGAGMRAGMGRGNGERMGTGPGQGTGPGLGSGPRSGEGQGMGDGPGRRAGAGDAAGDCPVADLAG